MNPRQCDFQIITVKFSKLNVTNTIYFSLFTITCKFIVITDFVFSVPDAGNSRNTSYAINLISTFFICSKTCIVHDQNSFSAPHKYSMFVNTFNLCSMTDVDVKR